jgi:carboxyl-terminal processing protease
MKEVQTQKPKGLVLDLRNNPGGLLHAAGVVMSNFVPNRTTYALIYAKEETTKEVTDEEPTIDASVPVVVIVNKGSASASEITAGALQDLKRAIVIGEQTYGKGTVQQVWRFNDGSSFKMTIAEWKTPSGRKIDGVGLEPDVLIATTAVVGGRDEAMLKALERLR